MAPDAARTVWPTKLSIGNLLLRLGYAYRTGGLSSHPDCSSNTQQFGVSLPRAKSENDLLEKLPPDLEAYRAAGIVWFVAAPDDPRMEGNTSRWFAAGEIALKTQFGDLKIYRRSDSAPAHGPG